MVSGKSWVLQFVLGYAIHTAFYSLFVDRL